MRTTPAILTLALALISVCAGCASQGRPNPSFPLTKHEAREDLRRMRADPEPAGRPIVVMAGLADPFLAPVFLKARIREAVSPKVEVIRLDFFFEPTFEACRDKVLDTVERGLGTLDTEVDVIGFSMGGLVARYAAMEAPDDPRRLRIRRLITISTPHRGTDRGWLLPLDPRATSMTPGSAFLGELDAGLADATYELTCYSQLGDWIVPPRNAAPPGRWAYWVPRGAGIGGHGADYKDPRFLADILRRLRGEASWTLGEPAPIPGGEPPEAHRSADIGADGARASPRAG